MKIPIFTDEVAQGGGWHGVALQEAFAKQGHEVVFVDLNLCSIDLSGPKANIKIPQLNDLPAIAFVRGIAAGSLQQVITRLNILHMLKMQGVYIYNDAKAIERTVDKGMTSFLLKHHGIATPKTWICESRKEAHHLIHTLLQVQSKVVIKPLFGSQGKGVRLLTHLTPLPVPFDDFVDGVYYLQAFTETGKHHYDYRAFVINGKVVATMQRSGKSWLNNVAQGATCTLVDDVDVSNLAIGAAKAVNIDYCGVDIMRDIHGQLWVIEVNSIPAWSGLQGVVNVNIAELLVQDLLNKSNETN